MFGTLELTGESLSILAHLDYGFNIPNLSFKTMSPISAIDPLMSTLARSNLPYIVQQISKPFQSVPTPVSRQQKSAEFMNKLKSPSRIKSG